MVRKRASNESLVIFLEAKELGALPEATAADVKSILADDTTAALADSAAPLKGALSVCAGMLRNKVDWHRKGRT